MQINNKNTSSLTNIYVSFCKCPKYLKIKTNIDLLI